jgi:hypothetical protein
MRKNDDCPIDLFHKDFFLGEKGNFISDGLRDNNLVLWAYLDFCSHKTSSGLVIRNNNIVIRLCQEKIGRFLKKSRNL